MNISMSLETRCLVMEHITKSRTFYNGEKKGSKHPAIAEPSTVTLLRKLPHDCINQRQQMGAKDGAILLLTTIIQRKMT